MKQPDLQARKEYADIVNDEPTVLRIGRRKFILHWLKPYTMERLTKIWIERDLASAEVKKGSDVLKDLAKEPYFAFKEAALMLLNHDIKIRLFYGFLWRYLAHKYNETQIVPIVEAGKKKLPVSAHYRTMVFSKDMRTDMIRMTEKEAGQYQAELLSVAKQLSARTSQDTAALGGGSSAGSATSGTGAF